MGVAGGEEALTCIRIQLVSVLPGVFFFGVCLFRYMSPCSAEVCLILTVPFFPGFPGNYIHSHYPP